MYNYKMIIAYDGSKYLGWQKQITAPDKTLQGKLENVLSLLFNEPIQVISSGRTDAGVHAKGQTANFHTTTLKPIGEILDYLQTYLPKDIAILELKEAGPRFHARYNCIGKRYYYTVDTSLFANPFTRKYAYHLPLTLDVVAMQRASEHLLGKHDFKSFTSLKNKKKPTIKTIRSIEIIPSGNYIHFYFEGDGFLQHMVRILSGTLLEVGLHHLEADTIPSILEACDRSLAGPTAPAEGLTLEQVFYD